MANHQGENSLTDVISLYVFGGMVIMPGTMCQQKKEQKSKVKNWHISDLEKMRIELQSCLLEMIPNSSPPDFDLPAQPTVAPIAIQTFNEFDSAIITIEIWSRSFIVRAWANGGDGSSDCFPIYQSEIQQSEGATALMKSVYALMTQLMEKSKTSEFSQPG
jgi:hypothetical protein